MLKKCLYIGLMLIAVIAVAEVAVAAGTDVEGTHKGVSGYMVQPAMDNGIDPYSYSPALYSTQEYVVTSVNSNISPGERKHYIKNVTQDIYFLNVDLAWMNPGVGLKLLVFSPSGEQVGLFCDGSDGTLDQRINIDIFESNGGYIENGRWDYYVFYDWGAEPTEFTI
jgi:hypothetical protein